MLKKGAMFGLDARIALAIFGALSVISGAALYSAIQDSKATAILVGMQEVAKASEQFYLDTGVELSQFGTSTDWEKSERISAQLISDTKAGWKGPYLPNEISTNNALRANFNADSDIRLIYLNHGSTWGNGTSWTPAGYCTVAADPCSLWVYISVKPGNQGLAEAIDVKVDGEVDAHNGNFKWIHYAASTHLFLKIMPADFSI
jgi:Tfp pilus assembly protein PilE